MIKYSYNNEDQILIVKFSGTVTFDELFDHVSPKEDRQHYPKYLKVLTNARTAKIHIKTTELQLIKKRLLETISNFDKLFDAFVVEGPMETALSIMYKEIGKNSKHEFKVFSTEEAAIHWLKKK